MTDGQKVRRKSSVTRDSLEYPETEVCLMRLKERVHIRGNSILLNCKHSDCQLSSLVPFLRVIVYSPVESNRRDQEPMEIRVIHTRIQ